MILRANNKIVCGNLKYYYDERSKWCDKSYGHILQYSLTTTVYYKDVMQILEDHINHVRPDATPQKW